MKNHWLCHKAHTHKRLIKEILSTMYKTHVIRQGIAGIYKLIRDNIEYYNRN